MLQSALIIAGSAIIGALVGRYNRCTDGSCPLVANWRRGACYGAFLGLLAVLSSPR